MTSLKVLGLAVLLALTLSPLGLVAQAQPYPATLFAGTSVEAQTGALCRYRLYPDLVLTPERSVDYWVWQATADRVETLHDASGLGLGSKAVWLDTWISRHGASQFDYHLKKNLRPLPDGKDPDLAAWFDRASRALRTQRTSAATGPSIHTSTVETLVWDPQVWHRDLGIWFNVFLPRIAPEAPTFTLCLDSWHHLIFFTVRTAGEETVQGIACRRHDLVGQGLWSTLMHSGRVWVSLDRQPRLVRLDLTVTFSWYLPRMRLELLETGTANAEEWSKLQVRVAGGS